jgi:nitrite reductase (NADH) large subunit
LHQNLTFAGDYVTRNEINFEVKMRNVRLAIIGNGMVGHRCIEDIINKAEPGQFDITVFCEEPRVAYDRVHLSSYFLHHSAEQLSLVEENYYAEHNVNVRVGERAVTLNREEKFILSSSGQRIDYDKLILATGRRRLLCVPHAGRFRRHSALRKTQ